MVISRRLLAPFALVVCAGLAGCNTGSPLEPVLAASAPQEEEVEGRKMIGKPYKVGGRWFHPAEDEDYDKVGMASWYGPKFHGRQTANGERFNQNALTAAHPTLPLPSYVRVTKKASGRSVVVRVNDRGPFKRGRIIDLSKAAADELGIIKAGHAKVRVEYLGPAPVGGSDKETLLAAKAFGKKSKKSRSMRDFLPFGIGKSGDDDAGENEKPVEVQLASAEPAKRTRAGLPGVSVPGASYGSASQRDTTARRRLPVRSSIEDDSGVVSAPVSVEAYVDEPQETDALEAVIALNAEPEKIEAQPLPETVGAAGDRVMGAHDLFNTETASAKLLPVAAGN